MAKTVQLTRHVIRVRILNDRSSYQMLDKVGSGLDMLQVFSDYFRLRQQEPVEFNDDQEDLGIEKLEIDPEIRSIWGTVRIGEYGKSTKGRNRKTKKIDYLRTEDHAEDDEFYFRIHLPRNSQQGLAVFEKVGSRGVKERIFDDFRGWFRSQHESYQVETGRITSRELLDEILRRARARRFIIRRHFQTVDRNDMGRLPHAQDRLEMSLEIRPTGLLQGHASEALQYLLDHRKDLADLVHIDEFDFETPKMELAVPDEGTRFVDLADLDRFCPPVDITKYAPIVRGSHHPEFSKIDTAARRVVNEALDGLQMTVPARTTNNRKQKEKSNQKSKKQVAGNGAAALGSGPSGLEVSNGRKNVDDADHSITLPNPGVRKERQN